MEFERAWVLKYIKLHTLNGCSTLCIIPTFINLKKKQQRDEGIEPSSVDSVTQLASY